MGLFKLKKDNIITTETTRTRSGVVWMSPGFYGRFKGVLRRFYCLVYIYTIFLFQGLIWAYRGLKKVYITPLCIRDNAQPLTIQDVPKNGKIPKFCHFYKKYWLNGFNPRFWGCVSFSDFDNFIKF